MSADKKSVRFIDKVKETATWNPEIFLNYQYTKYYIFASCFYFLPMRLYIFMYVIDVYIHSTDSPSHTRKRLNEHISTNINSHIAWMSKSKRKIYVLVTLTGNQRDCFLNGLRAVRSRKPSTTCRLAQLDRRITDQWQSGNSIAGL